MLHLPKYCFFLMAKMSIRGKIKPEIKNYLTENGSKRFFFVVIVIEVQYIVGRYRFLKIICILK